MAEDELVPTGTYWDQESWDLARSAYIADLDTDPGAPDAFVAWLSRALDDHAQRTPSARAELAAAQRSDLGRQRGFGRTHPLRQSTVAALEQAIVEDRQQLGRVISRSGFMREAVLVAAARSRERFGRELLPAPARLPTRPPRRQTR